MVVRDISIGFIPVQCLQVRSLHYMPVGVRSLKNSIRDSNVVCWLYTVYCGRHGGAARRTNLELVGTDG